MSHVPVMVGEVVHYLVYDRTRLVLDGTVGCGGHARAILDACPHVGLVGVDRDPQALRIAKRVLAPYGSRVRLVEGNYTELSRIAGECGTLDGALLDFGVSSLQLGDPLRGFSYLLDGPLDMRMSDTGGTAAALIGRMTEMDLARVLEQYGEVRGASRIARAIKRATATGRLASTSDLKRAVDSALVGKSAPALLSKVFQAIRIAVNGELDNIRDFLGSIFACLNPNARLVFISYHSLEDRMIKDFFKRESAGCICPPGTPVCICGHTASLEVLTRRVVKPSETEVKENPRARSARLRAARVIPRGRVE
jgi:16S rRNA (cytosine1402-N4)-methyltransferase